MKPTRVSSDRRTFLKTGGAVAAGLLAQNPAPTDGDIDAAMSGNVCRCGTYVRIRQGIKAAARSLSSTSRKAA